MTSPREKKLTMPSITTRHLTSVRALSSRTAQECGEKVLAVCSAVKNVRSDLIAQYVQDLLTSGAWQKYELPNGKSYFWREGEFDYFLSANGLDPQLIDQAIKATGNRSLIATLTARTSGVDEQRRDLKTVQQLYPELALRLNVFLMGSATLRRHITRSKSLQDFVSGVNLDAKYRSTSGRWEVRWDKSSHRTTDSLAEAIVKRLAKHRPLARAVVKKLEKVL